MIDWRMGLMPDIGGTFMQAFEQGREKRRETDTRNALAAYATNPSEQTLNPLAQYAPEFVMQERRGMAQQQAQAQEREQEALMRRLQMVGRVASMADTPEKWDAGVDYLVQQGYTDLAAYKGQFSEESRQAAIAASMDPEKFIQRNQPVNLGPGSMLVDPNTGRTIASAPFAPREFTLKPGETAFSAPRGAFQGGFDGFMDGFLFGAEGGFNPRDPASGAPVNFGIDQAANPDIDVANLSKDQARQLYMERYWKPSGADQISDPRLQAVHADTAVNMGVQAAQGLLQQSGGDPARYLALREQRYRSLAQQNPGKYGSSLNGWLNRNQKLSQFVGLAPATPIASGGPAPAKPTWRTLSPQQAQQRGLPPGTVYQESPDGEVKPIGGQPSQQQAAKVRQKLTDLAPIEAQVARVESAMAKAEKDGWTGYVMGRVPGGLDAESDTFDKSVRLLATLVRKLTRTPGEGAMSDYESRLAEMTLPTRTDTAEGRREALAGIRELISNIRAGYEEMGGATAAPPQPAANAGRPTRNLNNTRPSDIDAIMQKYGAR